jgi:hypothetical protein
VADDTTPKRRLLTIVNPRKKISDMTDEERLGFARSIVRAAKPKMPQSPADETK